MFAHWYIPFWHLDRRMDDASNSGSALMFWSCSRLWQLRYTYEWIVSIDYFHQASVILISLSVIYIPNLKHKASHWFEVEKQVQKSRVMLLEFSLLGPPSSHHPPSTCFIQTNVEVSNSNLPLWKNTLVRCVLPHTSIWVFFFLLA